MYNRNTGDQSIRLHRLRTSSHTENSPSDPSHAIRGRLGKHPDNTNGHRYSHSQVVLLREFTHDWLCYHSTHTHNHACKVIEQFIKSLSHKPPFHQLVTPLPKNPNRLLSFINECQLKDEQALLQTL
ncbi:MAG: hypothetical protein P8104_01970, partial [Gammaproteobacteria bacterium]